MLNSNKSPRCRFRQPSRTKWEATKTGPWAFLQSIAIPVIVTVVGAWLVQGIAVFYSRQQQLIAQAQAVQYFLPYFDQNSEGKGGHSLQQRYLAIQSLINMGDFDQAADLVVALPHCYVTAPPSKGKDRADLQHPGFSSAEAVMQQGSQNVECPEQLPGGSPMLALAAVEDSPATITAYRNAQQNETEEQKQEDVYFTLILSTYYSRLLPRLLLLADAPDQTASRRAQSAVMSIFIGPAGIDALKEWAFSPRIRAGSWLGRRLAAIQEEWKHWASKTDGVASEVAEREGALLCLEQTLRVISRRPGYDVFIMRETSNEAFDPFQPLADGLLRIVEGEDSGQYSPKARSYALQSLNLLNPSQIEPSKYLEDFQRIAVDTSQPPELHFAAITALSSPQNSTETTFAAFRTIIANHGCDYGHYESELHEACDDLIEDANDPVGLKEALKMRLASEDVEGDWAVQSLLDLGASADEFMAMYQAAKSPHRKLAVLDVFPTFAAGIRFKSRTKPTDPEKRKEIAARGQAIDEFTARLTQDPDPPTRARGYAIRSVIGQAEADDTERGAVADSAPVVVQFAAARMGASMTEWCQLLPQLQKTANTIQDAHARATTLPFVFAAQRRCIQHSSHQHGRGD